MGAAPLPRDRIILNSVHSKALGGTGEGAQSRLIEAQNAIANSIILTDRHRLD